MNSDKLQELRRLAEQATQGEWKVDVRVGCIAVYKSNLKINCIDELEADDKVVYYRGYWDGDKWNVRDVDEKNATYIAAANPDTILQLLDYIESLPNCIYTVDIREYEKLEDKLAEAKAHLDTHNELIMRQNKEIERLNGQHNFDNAQLSEYEGIIQRQDKEIERLNKSLQYEQHRTGRIGTHAEGCYKWGAEHYECAMQEIERLKKEIGCRYCKHSGTCHNYLQDIDCDKWQLL